MKEAIVTQEFAKATCKFGEGETCCKYLVFGPGGFECVKLNIGFRQMIDARTDMVAKGDNCPGKPDALAEFLTS